MSEPLQLTSAEVEDLRLYFKAQECESDCCIRARDMRPVLVEMRLNAALRRAMQGVLA